MRGGREGSRWRVRDERMERETESERASPGDGEITDCSYSTSEQASEQPGLLSWLGAREQKAGATFFFELPASPSGKRLPLCCTEAPKRRRAKTRRRRETIWVNCLDAESSYLLNTKDMY